MRVLVIGVGIIGTIYGWVLAEGGHHVVHLVRSGRADAFPDGLPLDVFDRGCHRFVDHDWTIISILKAADVSFLRVGTAENFQGFLIIVGNGPLRP